MADENNTRLPRKQKKGTAQALTPEQYQALAEKRWIDSYDLRCLLCISESTMANWCEKGILRPAKVEKKIYFDLADVHLMLEERKGKK